MSSFTDFIDRKRREHERAVARHTKRGSPVTWRMKLRVRLLSRLNTDALELRLRFRGRVVLVRARAKGTPLNESDWIVFVARRFRSIEAAAEFGVALQTAISAIAAARHIPVDVGADNKATSTTGEVIKAAVAKKGIWLIDDVHGVDVFPDTQTAMAMFGDVNVTSTMNPDRLTGPLEESGRSLGKLDQAGREAALLVNAAYMAPHPVAMLTLGVAAVELLAPNNQRTAAQRAWIAQTRRDLTTAANLSEEERLDLSHAMNGLNRLSVLSKTRSLLADLELQELVQPWTKLYQERSRLFHGDRIAPFSELQAMGSKALQVCQTVVTAYIARSVGVDLR